MTWRKAGGQHLPHQGHPAQGHPGHRWGQALGVGQYLGGPVPAHGRPCCILYHPSESAEKSLLWWTCWARSLFRPKALIPRGWGLGLLLAESPELSSSLGIELAGRECLKVTPPLQV